MRHRSVNVVPSNRLIWQQREHPRRVQRLVLPHAARKRTTICKGSKETSDGWRRCRYIVERCSSSMRSRHDQLGHREREVMMLSEA